MKFSRIEKRDLLKAWVAVSIAFAIVMSGGLSAGIGILTALFVSAFTVGIGFIVHELSHKFLAQRYGCWAEFRAFNKMLIIMILMSFFGFILAAPGAVMIQGNVGRVRNGRISAAGPASSLILAAAFLLLFGTQWLSGATGILSLIGIYGFAINSWLAFFNLLPFLMFDGKKIYVWNRQVYILLMATAFIFSFIITPMIR